MAYQKDISAVLGLSISTVSKALKGYPDISEETRKKVLRTAEELDYKYRDGRRGPRAMQRMSGTIGILAPGSSDLVKSPYYREMVPQGPCHYGRGFRGTGDELDRKGDSPQS